MAACYGKPCTVRTTCQRWHAADGNTNERQVWIAHCGDGRPLYIPIKELTT